MIASIPWLISTLISPMNFLWGRNLILIQYTNNFRFQRKRVTSSLAKSQYIAERHSTHVNNTGSDLQVLSVRQEVHNYSVTYRHRLNDHPNNLAKSLFQRPNYNRRLKRYYPADLATIFSWYSTTFQETIPNHLRLRLNRRCINVCTSYMPFIVTAIAIRLLNVFGQMATFWEIIKKYIYSDSEHFQVSVLLHKWLPTPGGHSVL